MAEQYEPFRVGSHSKILVWHDPDPQPDVKSGDPVAMATSPEWAERIAEALNMASRAPNAAFLRQIDPDERYL